MEVASLGLIFSALAAAATVAIAFIAWSQLSAIAEQSRLQGERERQWRTLEVCCRMETDPILEEAALAVWKASNSGKEYDNITHVKREIIVIMNYLNYVSIGVQAGYYNDEIVCNHLESAFLKAEKEFLSSDRSAKIGIEVADYVPLTSIIKKWSSYDKKSPLSDD